MSVGFDELARNLMDEVLSWEPVFATQVGWHRYDSLLGDPSAEACSRQAERCRELIGRLSAVPAASLPPDELLDRDLGIQLLRTKAYELGELRLHERGYVGSTTLGYSLFFLFSREHPDVAQRIESIVRRVEAVPDFILKCRKSLGKPYRLWNEAAYEVGLEMPSLLRSMETFVGSRTDDGDTLRRTRQAVKEAVESVNVQNSLLKNEVLPSASEDYAITPDEYAGYLDVRGYGVTPEQLLEIGEAYLRLCRDAIAGLAKVVSSAGTHLDAIEAMKSDHPADFDAVLREYRASVVRAREFTAAKDLCTLPDGEELLVVETPEFMRPMFAFAGQFEPGKFDDSRRGLFVVTPVGKNVSLLREHSRAGIANTAVHEGYPGHHLQGICSNMNPSHVRVLSASPDFMEGWALYAERLMLEQGFNDTAFGRLAVTNDLLLRVVRLIIEVRLVLGTLDPEAAARMLASECSIDPGAARTEVRSCAMSPTYFSSYLLGKLALLQLRDDVRWTMGPHFSYKFFHDSLLHAGCLPMGFMRRAVSIRMKNEHGMDLSHSSESLHSYAMRRVRAGLV